MALGRRLPPAHHARKPSIPVSSEEAAAAMKAAAGTDQDLLRRISQAATDLANLMSTDPLKQFGALADLVGTWGPAIATGQIPPVPGTPSAAAGGLGLLPSQLVSALQDGVTPSSDAVQATAGNISDALKPAVQIMAETLQGFMEQAGLGDLSRNIDASGDLFAFVGSLGDVLIDEARLTSGPLSFPELLEYENRITGIRTCVVLACFAFSLIVEVVSLGQVEGFVGLVLHLVDDAVGDASRIVSTQLIRRAVADPYSEGFKAVHRTGRLASNELIELHQYGLATEKEVIEGLALDGFNDRAIEGKVHLARIRLAQFNGKPPVRTKKISVANLSASLRAGSIDQDEFVRQLADRGYEDEDVELLLNLALVKAPGPAPISGE